MPGISPKQASREAVDAVPRARPRYGDHGRQLSCRQVSAAAWQTRQGLFPRGRHGLFQGRSRAATARSSRSPIRMLAERDVLRELTDGKASPPMSGWCCCTIRCSAPPIPKPTVANAFGDRYIYSLCPSAPEARAYAVGLARDVTESYPVSGISLETPGFLPYAHGFHHEFALNAPNRWLDNQLGLCFCDHCIAGAQKAGHRCGAAEGARSRATSSDYLASDIDFPADMAEAFWLADTRSDGELGAFLDWRCTVVTSLVAEIRAACARTRLSRSSPRWRARPAAPGMKAAISAALAEAAGIIEACFYEPGAARVKADLFDIKRRLRGTGKLRGILRPGLSRSSRASGEFLAAVERARRGRRRRARLLQLGPSAQRQCRLDRRRHETPGEARMTFKGKVVAITGAAGGIGQALCRYFAAEGAAIAAIDKSAASTLSPTSCSARIRRTAVADIGDADAVATAFAGSRDRARARRHSRQQCRLLRSSDLRAHRSRGLAARCQRQSQRRLLLRPCRAARHEGEARRLIIAIGSVNGLGALGDPAYSAAKAGMISLTRSLALEYGRYGIRSNIVLPGTVRTPLWERRAAKNPEVLEQLVRWYPLGRIVEPDRCGARRRLPRFRCGRRPSPASRSPSIAAVGRQYRHGARTDARGFLRRWRWTDCASASSDSAGSARSTARPSSAFPISSLRRCARARPSGLQALAREIRRQENLSRLSRPAGRSRHRCRLDRHHVGPAHRARRRRARGRQACLPRKADGLDGRRLQARSSPRRRRPRAFCRSAISAASIRATAWPSRRSMPARSARSSRMSSRRNIPAAWTPEILEQDRPDRRRRHPRHRPHAVVHRRPGRQRLCPDGRRARAEASRHRPDHVPLRRRRHGDARDRLVHAGEDALRHRRAHVDHRHRGHHPCPGHLPQSRHRRRRTSCTARTRPIGRCSTACAAARCARNSPISPIAR